MSGFSIGYVKAGRYLHLLLLLLPRSPVVPPRKDDAQLEADDEKNGPEPAGECKYTRQFHFSNKCSCDSLVVASTVDSTEEEHANSAENSDENECNKQTKSPDSQTSIHTNNICAFACTCNTCTHTLM